MQLRRAARSLCCCLGAWRGSSSSAEAPLDATPLSRAVRLRPYGVLGTRLEASGAMVAEVPPPTDGRTAFVDPAGLHHIQPPGGPSGAGGAAGAIYRFLGIADAPAFPADVVAAVTATGCAKHHEYALPPGPASYALRHGREAPAPAAPVGHAIHVVGPDLRVGAPTWDGAVAALATAYRNALAEFDASELPTLRLLPISGGIFAGAFRERVPRLTREALDAGFAQLPEATQQRLLSRERTLELCIFAEAEFEGFVRVGFHPDAGYAEATS